MDAVRDGRERMVNDERRRCRHERWHENRRVHLEHCDDCGAWRDRVSLGPESWFWRKPGSFERADAE